jgi:hypothetical protein
MKKFLNSFLIAIVAVAIIILSCNKSEKLPLLYLQSDNNNGNIKQNEATWTYSESTKSNKLFWKIYIGHTVSDCGGKCIKLFGEWGHIDCVGMGNVCSSSVEMSIEPGDGDDDFILILDDANAFGAFLEYPFPDRSLMITNPQNNTDLWLNIPEQILNRESEEVSFVIYDAWFSEIAELENR